MTRDLCTGREPTVREEPYCSICQTPVMVYTDAAGDVVQLEHARLGFDNHTPVPVPLAEISNPDQLCDFCSAPDPQWMFRSQKEVIVALTEERVDRLGTTWLACDLCAPLVESKNQEVLLYRVMRTFGGLGNEVAIRKLLEPVYAHLFEEIGEKEYNSKGKLDGQ